MSPGRHYVAFGDERDLVVKVNYYLANATERLAIADAGRRHSEEKLSANAYWKRLFTALGLDEVVA
jgi:hypothetical protein